MQELDQEQKAILEEGQGEEQKIQQAKEKTSAIEKDAQKEKEGQTELPDY